MNGCDRQSFRLWALYRVLPTCSDERNLFQEIQMNSNFKQASLRAVLAVALAAAAVSSYAVEGVAGATATVIAPIAINKAVDLNFGKFAPGTGGSITISTSGTPTSTGIVRSTTVTPTAARFDVTGDANATYAITYTGTSTTLSDGATTPSTMGMSIHSSLTANNATTGTVTDGLLTGGAQSIYVGGTLTVGATQVAGTYTGNVSVQVEYN
jgi:hypothetical protein